MTRINVVPVRELSDKHLVAEYREIMRLPNNLRTSLARQKPFSWKEIPSQYTLGKGHVKFFYDKMEYLDKRFKQLCNEMLNRGFTVNFLNFNEFKNCDIMYYNDYKPTQDAIEINRIRIKERS